jgi:RNA polymerase sigma-70 factor (ECF subfamily)
MDQSATFGHHVPPALIERLKRGDMAAFERIYREFERATYTLALRLTGRRQAASEVLQDAMLKAYERAGQYRGEAPFGAWLKRLVVNQALMHLRRERCRASEIFEDIHPDTTGGEPWHVADAATLERALSQLPDTARAVLWLYHVEGYTHPEIAAEFGRSVSFSKSQLARATRRLRQLLAPAEEAVPCPARNATTL